MEAMAQTWNDDRIDELSARVDAGFAQARVDLASTREELREQGDELRREIKEQGDELRREIKEQGSELRQEIKEQGKELRQEMNVRFNSVDARFDALHATVIASQRTMLQICGGLAAALIAAVATLIVAVL